MALVVTQSVHVAPTFAVVDGFYVASDNQAFESVALFDSEMTASAHWPCQSDAARRNLSEVGTYVRSLGEGSSTVYGVEGRGCQLINSSVSGTSWYGWMYPAINNGVADFNGGRSGTGDPRHADTCYQPNPSPMGAGRVRIVGELEKPPTGLGFSASVTLVAKPGQCVNEGTLASYAIASIPGQKTAATATFDITVDIPDGTRNLALTIRGGEPRCTTQGGNCGVYVHNLRMYASLGANAPDPQIPTPLSIPDEQSFGLGGAHGNTLNRLESDPVNTATGNYVSTAGDFALPGRGLNLAFTRSYNSLDAVVGPFGPGWRHAYQAALGFEAGGVVRFTAEDGAQYLYQPDGSGGYLRPTAGHSTLAALGDGTYHLTRRDQAEYHFAADGRLLELADRNGNALTFSYTGNLLTTITDTVGRTIALGYDANDRLASLSGPPDRSVTYTYDAAGRLATATDVLDGMWQYSYDTADRLTTIIDPNDHTLVTNTYGTDGRVSSQTNAVNQTGQFDWDPVTQTSTYTDARGGVWTDVYRRNVLQSSSDPLGRTNRYTYDAAGNRTSITDPRGNTTSYTYDAAGNVLTQTAPAPLSYVETWTYTARNDVATYIDGRNNTTTFSYDVNGNLSQVEAPLAATTSYARDPAGTGLLLSSNDPRSKTTSYGYDAQANLTSVTSPTGNVTTMTYDGAGRMLTLVDPRGNAAGADPADFTTTFTYDAGDRVLTTTDPLGSVSTVTYDAVGNRLTVTDASQHATGYGYDAANRLTSVTDALDGVTAYAYDEVGNLVTRTDANQHVTTYAYDLDHHLTSTTDPLSNAWDLTYDAAGNVLTRTDANRNTTTYGYDALNRLATVTYADPATPSVSYSYDANGNRTTMVDGAGTETYGFDALNRPTAVARGADVFSYGYDLAGNVISRSYPGEAEQTLTYDDDGRLTTGNGATYTYDEAGNLLTAATPDGITSNYAYDRAGRLLEVAHAGASDTLSRFTDALDAVGNRTAMTTRDGTVTYRYDPLNRLAEACWSDTTCPGGAPTPPQACLGCVGGLLARPGSTTQPPAGETFVAYAYDPVGNRLNETRDAGTTPFTYDAADRLLTEGTALPGLTTPAPSATSGAWASGAGGYVSDDTYASAAPGKNQTLSQTYGGFDFSAIPAEATINQVSLSVEWAVDTGSAQATLTAQPRLNGSPYGSALTNTAGPTSDTVETQPLTGLSLADLSGGSLEVVIAAAKANGPSFIARLDAVTVSVDYTYGLRTFTYDANGNQLSAGSTTYTYDLADRLASATVGSTTETYTYAGDGTRLSAATGPDVGEMTRYLWDRAFGLPQLALERDGADTLLRSYRYGLDLLSQTAGSSSHLYHHDGLGSVVDVTEPAGASMAWSEYYPFGEVRLAGSDAGPAVQPFGFTGEQLDPLTGLYHLRARQYDPGTGRFLSTDPVAPLLTDPYVGTYVYARNMTTVAVDPSGQFAIAIPLAMLAAPVVKAVAVVTVTAVASAGAWVAGSAVGSALNELARPESQPRLVPGPPPGVDQDPAGYMSQLNKTPNMLGNRPPMRCRGAAIPICIGIGGVALAGGAQFLSKFFEWLRQSPVDNEPRIAPAGFVPAFESGSVIGK